MTGSLTRRAAIAVALLSVAALAACGDSEADQRQAFIKFLQDINSRPGVHFLNPTAADQKAFGDYMSHYNVIMTYNRQMSAVSKDFSAHAEQIISGRSAQSVEQIVANRDAIANIKVELARVLGEVDKHFAETNSARAALKQPDDLKAVYDVTFDRLVTKPTLATRNHMLTLDNVLAASLQLADFVKSHADKLQLKGSQILATDQQTLAELNAVLATHKSAAEKLQEAGRNLQRVLQGS